MKKKARFNFAATKTWRHHTSCHQNFFFMICFSRVGVGWVGVRCPLKFSVILFNGICWRIKKNTAWIIMMCVEQNDNKHRVC